MTGIFNYNSTMLDPLGLSQLGNQLNGIANAFDNRQSQMNAYQQMPVLNSLFAAQSASAPIRTGIWERASAYDDPFRNAIVFINSRFAGPENRPLRRIIGAKELMHVFDTDEQRASDPEKFRLCGH